MAYDGVAERRILHDGDLLGDLGQQPHSTYQHVVEVECSGEEGLDSALLRGRERFQRAEPVDEQSITLVRRNAASAGVRLHDVALFLEGSHIVADRRRRDPKVMMFDQRPGPHRLLAGHVVGDDGAKYFQFAVVHASPS
jgi:hypothetical protein